MEILDLVCKIVGSLGGLFYSVCFFYGAIYYHKFDSRSMRMLSGALGVMFLVFVIFLWIL